MATPNDNTQEVTTLIKALEKSVAWVDPLVQLHTALVPFANEETNIQGLVSQREALTKQVETLNTTIDTAEQHLATVNQRLVLEEDARKQQIDADLVDYRASIDSQKRQFESELKATEQRVGELAASATEKKQTLVELDSEIATRTQSLTQLKSQLADVLKQFQGVSHAQG